MLLARITVHANSLKINVHLRTSSMGFIFNLQRKDTSFIIAYHTLDKFDLRGLLHCLRMQLPGPVTFVTQRRISVCSSPMMLQNCHMWGEQWISLARCGEVRSWESAHHVTVLLNPPFDPNMHITTSCEEGDITEHLDLQDAIIAMVTFCEDDTLPFLG